MMQHTVEFCEGPVEGVAVKPLRRFNDARGWLIELFRDDELGACPRPAMAYVSQTLPGVVRGPHEHREQSDRFCFVGPGDFELWCWDARPASSTRGKRCVMIVGQSNPAQVVIPPGVVHAYRNIGGEPGLVMNFPDQLYAGRGHREPVDEIRYEAVADSPFKMG
jgi:dTDP-4-dehydrorhamnose 3,5-epimerase